LEVCFDDEELDTKIYDLMASSRKSKAPRKKDIIPIKTGIQMKGIFWNSRGLANLAKYRYISDVVKEHNLDFIAVMETGKQDMSKTSLNRLSGGADFIWHCLPPKGRSGGILLGVNAMVLNLSIVVEGEFYIKFYTCNKIDNFKWILIVVYGPAQDSFKTAFLSELVRACQ
jgi:hypothetical protein